MYFLIFYLWGITVCPPVTPAMSPPPILLIAHDGSKRYPGLFLKGQLHSAIPYIQRDDSGPSPLLLKPFLTGWGKNAAQF